MGNTTTIAAKDVRNGQVLCKNGTEIGTVVNVDDRRDPGGIYRLIVVEIEEDVLFADFRVYDLNLELEVQE
jgi:sporulation protein YlmC with PRC-barrel domain